MVVVSRIAAACFIVALPLFLITANVRILATDADYYKHGFRKYHAAETTGVPLADLDRAAGQIVSYFEDDSDTLRIIVTEDGQEVSLFNARETQHMQDVKTLMRFVFRLNEVSLAVILSYVVCVFLWSREKPLRALAVQALAGVALGFTVILAIGAFALTGFDQAWTKFHEIAFSNDLWKLNPATDHLIQMFPEKFWEEATFFVAALTVGEALAIVIAAAAYLVFTRKRDTASPRPAASAATTAPDATTSAPG
jgi:integral membrane protein (TIGR01906 family)